MNLLFVSLSVISAGLIIVLLSKFNLREKYLVIWMIISALCLIFGFVSGPLSQAMQNLGFKVYSNFFFVVFGTLYGILLFQLSLTLSRMEDKIQSLVEKLAILEFRISSSKKSKVGKNR